MDRVHQDRYQEYIEFDQESRFALPEEVKHDTDYGYEYQHQHPRHCLGRLPVVHEHGDHSHQHYTDVQHEYEPMKVYHFFNS